MRFPWPTQIVSVIHVQFVPVNQNAVFLNVHKHPPGAIHSDQRRIQRLLCFDQHVLELPVARKRIGSIKLDYIFVAGFRDYVVVATPFKDKRIGEVAVQFQCLGWTTHDSVFIDFDYGNVSSTCTVQIVLKENVVLFSGFDRKRICPKTIQWWNQVFEFTPTETVGHYPLLERGKLFNRPRSRSLRELEKEL